MATGNELVLGFPRKRWKETPFGTLDPDAKDADDKVSNTAEAELEQAHAKALTDMGFKYLGHSSQGGKPLYPVYETPLGEREFSPFILELHYDPGELREKPDDAILGVSISSRYFPRFADWKDESGALWNINFGDDDLKKAMEIAKKRIVEVLPWMSGADWIVKENFY